MCPSKLTVSQIERDIGRKSSFSHSPLAFDAPLKGFPTSRRNIATPFGIEKLEWLGEKNIEYIFIRFDVIHERDGRTDTECICIVR